MKQRFSKAICVTLAVAALLSACAIPGAAEGQEEEGFTPERDSTWADLYRYFDPEGFEELPVYVQNQYDQTLLMEETDSASDTMADEMEHDIEIASADGFLYTSNGYEEMDVVSATDFLYTEDGLQALNSDKLDVGAILELVLGVSPGKTTIDYTAELFATIQCPYMAITVSIYDAEANKFIALDAGHESNAAICNVSGTFDNLTSKHEYTVKTISSVNPPTGYYGSGVLTSTITKKTK